MRPRVSRPRWASLEVAGDGSAYYWGLSWPDLWEVAFATNVMRRMASGGEAEAAIRMDVKEQSLKG